MDPSRYLAERVYEKSETYSRRWPRNQQSLEGPLKNLLLRSFGVRRTIWLGVFIALLISAVPAFSAGLSGFTVNVLNSKNATVISAVTDVTGFYYFPATSTLVSGQIIRSKFLCPRATRAQRLLHKVSFGRRPALLSRTSLSTEVVRDACVREIKV
jgi:hypothetical protein